MRNTRIVVMYRPPRSVDVELNGWTFNKQKSTVIKLNCAWRYARVFVNAQNGNGRKKNKTKRESGRDKKAAPTSLQLIIRLNLLRSNFKQTTRRMNFWINAVSKKNVVCRQLLLSMSFVCSFQAFSVLIDIKCWSLPIWLFTATPILVFLCANIFPFSSLSHSHFYLRLLCLNSISNAFEFDRLIGTLFIYLQI